MEAIEATVERGGSANGLARICRGLRVCILILKVMSTLAENRIHYIESICSLIVVHHSLYNFRIMPSFAQQQASKRLRKFCYF